MASLKRSRELTTPGDGQQDPRPAGALCADEFGYVIDQAAESRRIAAVALVAIVAVTAIATVARPT